MRNAEKKPKLRRQTLIVQRREFLRAVAALRCPLERQLTF